MSLTVLDAGFQTLLVDAGRPKARRLGMPLGGAADRAALALANGLVGNAADAAALEVTMVGPTLQARERTACAFFGAPFALAVANKSRIAAGTAFTLEPGDAVKIGGTPTGVRAYFAVAGGFQSVVVLESQSGLEPVKVGETLACKTSAITPRGFSFDHLPPERLEGAVQIRVLPGPQYDKFLRPKEFFAAEYTVAPASDRMGLRLTGPSLERRAGEIASEAVAPGAVQITNDGLPVILGVDGQTIGGYPKIAHVIRADLDALAQLRPGDRVRFVKVTAEEAATAFEKNDTMLREWLTRLQITAATALKPLGN